MKTALVVLTLALSACGQSTPKYGIHYTGTEHAADIDTAWGLAAVFAGENPGHLAARQWIVLNVQLEPIEIAEVNGRCHGISQETIATVQQIGPSLLDADTPTVHEFFHIVLGLSTGDVDAGHTNSNWGIVNSDFEEK